MAAPVLQYCGNVTCAYRHRHTHTHTHKHKKRVHFESAAFLVFPVGGGQTRQSWRSQSRSARGNGVPHGTFMAGPAGGEGHSEDLWVCVGVCMYVSV